MSDFAADPAGPFIVMPTPTGARGRADTGVLHAPVEESDTATPDGGPERAGDVPKSKNILLIGLVALAVVILVARKG